MKTTLFNHDLAEIEISYRSKIPPSQRRKISSSRDAEEILRSIWSDTMEFREEFVILLLNRANRVLGYYKVSSGGMTGTIADSRIIFSVALKSCACAIILAHNHPSGNTQPSDADRKLTTNLKKGGEYLEISVLDHIILTSETYLSFADEGLM
jgi:DNA repair protein RadC